MPSHLFKGQKIVIQSEQFDCINGFTGTIHSLSARWKGMAWVSVDQPIPPSLNAFVRVFAGEKVIFLHPSEMVCIKNTEREVYGNA